MLSISPKNFKMGSRGFYANPKIEIEGKRQFLIQVIEVCTKKRNEVWSGWGAADNILAWDWGRVFGSTIIRL